MKINNGVVYLVLGTAMALVGAPVGATTLWGEGGSELGSHGYFRVGRGWSESGPQVCFKAPGAGAKYRLGNECEDFAKASLYYRHRFSAGEGAPYLHLEFMPVLNRSYGGERRSLTHDQLFVEWGNPGGTPLKLWLGRRYNQRRDVHINDFFYMNLQGDGLGVRDIPLGWGDLALTYLQSHRTPESVGAGLGDVPLRNYEASLYNLETNPGGSLVLDLRYATIGDVGPGTPDETPSLYAADGWALAVQHRQQGLFGATNTLVVQYGSGAARSAWTSPMEPETTVEMLTSPARADDLASAETWRLLDYLVYEGRRWAVMGVAIWEKKDHEAFDGIDQTWWSVGARPLLWLDDHWRIVAEIGLDRVESPAGSGALEKFTLAAEWTPERRFFSRPALRAYVTQAAWSDEFRGQVGDPAFGDRTSGWSIGLQVENWW